MKRIAVALLLALIPISAFATSWFAPYNGHCLSAAADARLMKDQNLLNPYAFKHELVTSHAFTNVVFVNWGSPATGDGAVAVEAFNRSPDGKVTHLEVFPFFTSRAYCQRSLTAIKDH